jgi:hypothetical protein
VVLRLRLPRLSKPESDDGHARQRVSLLHTTFVRLGKQPPADAAADWMRACSECSHLLGAACSIGTPWGGQSCAALFVTLQLAMQTGPLHASKAARFGRLRGWCGGLSEHPHARAVWELLAAAERAVCRGIELSDRQAAQIERWRRDLVRAFPADASTASEGDEGEPPSDESDDDDASSFAAMEAQMRSAFYPVAAGSSYAPAPS